MKAVFATTTAQIALPDGGAIVVRFGSHWPADDPVVVAHPNLFSDNPRYGLSASRPIPEDGPVEQVTAGPGEKRATRRSA